MQKKALVGTILILFSFVMIALSLGMPWYTMKLEMSYAGESSSITVDYYLDHAEVSGSVTSSDLDYDDAEAEDLNFVNVYKTTNTLVFLGIIGCILGLIGAAMLFLGNLGSKGFAVLILLAVILSVFAPLYIMFALPNAFEEQTDTTTISPEEAGKNFFGSEKQELIGGTIEYTWGGSSGWYATFFAAIMCLIALILVAISKPSPEPKYQEPQVPFESSQQPEAGFFPGQQANSPSYQEEIYHQASPAPSTRPQGEEFQCPECWMIFILATTKRPAILKCPYCGLEGLVE